MTRFQVSPGFVATSRMTADFPSLSTIDAVAEKVPGTIPSLVPTSIAPEVFGKDTDVPRDVAEMGAPTYCWRWPVVT